MATAQPSVTDIGQEHEIPTFCKAGVVTKEGPDFEMEVQMVPVPEPGMQHLAVQSEGTK